MRYSFLTRSCVIISMVIQITSATIYNVGNTNNLISKDDLPKYIEVLESVSKYCEGNDDKVNIDLAFGLFLTNVQLKYIKSKARNVSEIITEKLEEIFRTNEDSINLFRVRTDPKVSKIDREVSVIFNNLSDWTVESYDENSNNHVQFKNGYLELPNWNEYERYIHDITHWNPNPQQSDNCLLTLGANLSENRNNGECKLDPMCHSIIRNGSNYGYALAHRILVLMVAHRGMSCNIFTPTEDKFSINRWCSLAYAENENVASHNFKFIDIILEFITLCTFEGHSEFLLRSWVNEAFLYQSHVGCFCATKAIPKASPNGPKLCKCQPHTTALGSAAMAASVRYIVEKFY